MNGPVVRILAWLTIAALALPIALIAVLSFNDAPTFVFPPKEWSLRWYANLFATPVFGTGFLYSLALGLASAAIGIAAGTAAAVALVRYRFPGRQSLNALIMAPMLVPEAVTGLALLIWFHAIAWAPGDPHLLLLHCLVVLPYIVRVMAASLMRADPHIEEAARTLGATPLRAFVLVTLPTLRNGLLAALIFALVMSFHNFTATFFLTVNKQTLPVAIFQYIRTESDPTIAALSTLMMLGAALIVFATDRLIGLDRATK